MKAVHHADIHRKADRTSGQRVGVRGDDAQRRAQGVEESGNHAYIMHRAVDNPRIFMSYEEYTDQAALEAHRRHLWELGVGLRAVLAGPPDGIL